MPLNSPTVICIDPSGRVRILGLGVGDAKASFIALKSVEVILALDSAK